jgi:iron(III) transport system permease protein
MIGGKTTTLAVMMYQEVLGQLDFGRGSIIGILLLVPAVFSFIVTALLKNIEKQGYETKSFQIRRNLLRDGLAYVLVGIIICGVVALIGAFCVVAFTVKYPSNMTITWSNVRKMFTLRGGIYLRNSVIIALSVAFIGSFVAFVTAYLTVRVPSKISRLLHLLSITTLAIPGLVLGLSYAIAFSKNLMYQSKQVEGTVTVRPAF